MTSLGSFITFVINDSFHTEDADTAQGAFAVSTTGSKQMPKKQPAVRLSAGELEIIAMLWELGPLTLAQAHQQFDRFGGTVSYPTMQTRLNRMVAKGLAHRSDARPAVYQAAVSRDQVSAGHLGQLVAKVGQQSVVPLVAQLIHERPLSAAEIDELKRLLDVLEKQTPRP